MRQRGRVSAAALSVVQGSRRQDIEPPKYLSREEADLFREIVASVKPGHFVPSDKPLLTAYIQAAWASQENARKMVTGDLQSMKAFESATRVMATLATRLRLAPQSRIQARAAGRGMRGPGRPSLASLQMEEDEDS